MAKKNFSPPKNDNLAEPMSDLVPEKYKGTDRYLDLVAWNIRYFHDRDAQRVENVVEVLSALNADVFVFEEILDQSLEVVAHKLGQIGAGNYTTAYGTTGGQQRVAMMHDIDWVRAKDDVVELFSRGEVTTGTGKDAFPRLPLHGSFTTLPHKDGTPFDFQLVGLHLKSQRVSSAASDGEDAVQRTVAANRLARWLTTDAPAVDSDVILVGDWNKPPSAPEWRAFHKLEDQGEAVFRKANDDSDVSHLMYRNASEYGSRLDIGAMSISASQQLAAGATAARWKSLDDLLGEHPKGKEIKQLIHDLSRDVSDHMPVVLRFTSRMRKRARCAGVGARRRRRRRGGEGAVPDERYKQEHTPMSARDQYTKEIANRFGGYFAAWTPGVPHALGDFGTLEGKAFTRIGNVHDLGIAFAVRPDPTPETIGPYKSSGKVSVAFKAAGTATLPNSQLAQADAGFSLNFSGDHAVVFIAENCLQPSIEDQVKMGRDIIAAFKDGKWSKSWRVITQLVESSAMTVLISASSNGAIDLKATGAVTATPGEADLGKANMGLQVQFSRDMETMLVAQAGVTPMFKLSAIKKPLFGKPGFKALSLRAPDPQSLGELPLAGVTPAMLKNNPALESIVTFGEVEG